MLDCNALSTVLIASASGYTTVTIPSNLSSVSDSWYTALSDVSIPHQLVLVSPYHSMMCSYCH